LTRDKRIYSTGCADENAKLTDCYYEKKDWRACKQEVSFVRVSRCLLLASGPRLRKPRKRRNNSHLQAEHEADETIYRWRSSDNAGSAMAMIRGRIQKTLHSGGRIRRSMCTSTLYHHQGRERCKESNVMDVREICLFLWRTRIVCGN
jgi:hypothetical protein